jgi:hypothetical protein
MLCNVQCTHVSQVAESVGLAGTEAAAGSMLRFPIQAESDSNRQLKSKLHLGFPLSHRNTKISFKLAQYEIFFTSLLFN